jgi:hypothetical protein
LQVITSFFAPELLIFVIATCTTDKPLFIFVIAACMALWRLALRPTISSCGIKNHGFVRQHHTLHRTIFVGLEVVAQGYKFGAAFSE